MFVGPMDFEPYPHIDKYRFQSTQVVHGAYPDSWQLKQKQKRKPCLAKLITKWMMYTTRNNGLVHRETTPF